MFGTLHQLGQFPPGEIHVLRSLSCVGSRAAPPVGARNPTIDVSFCSPGRVLIDQLGSVHAVRGCK